MAFTNRGGSESPSRTMRLADLISRKQGNDRNDRIDRNENRQISASPERPSSSMLYPVTFVPNSSNSVISRSNSPVISRSRGNSGNSVLLRPPEGQNSHDRLYYQAQVAHLQTALVKEHSHVVRVTIGFSIAVLILLLIIIFLVARPANCDHVGHRYHIPVFSPWSSAHEKEQYTTGGWNLTSAALFPAIALLAWQNREFVVIPVIRFLTSHVSEIHRYLNR